MKRSIYLDHAATSPLRESAKNIVLENIDVFGNPSSVHRYGQEARHLLDGARRGLAEIFGMRGEQVVFTSGGTEANNLVLKGVMAAHKGERLVVSATEHSCVKNTAAFLAEEGVLVTVLPVNRLGGVDMDALDKVLEQGDVALVSVHAVNNETGVMQEISEIADKVKSAGALFHTDAVQAPLLFEKEGLFAGKADFITLAGHKFGALKGAGALLIRGNPEMKALVTGGAQERNRRAGTEGVHAIISQTAAMQEYFNNKDLEESFYKKLEDKVRLFCEKHKGKIQLVAQDAPLRARHIFQLYLLERYGEDMVMTLDIKGVCVSQGSACTSGRVEPSYVLQAMGFDAEEAMRGIRVSVGHTTIEEDIDVFLEVLEKCL